MPPGSFGQVMGFSRVQGTTLDKGKDGRCFKEQQITEAEACLCLSQSLRAQKGVGNI